MQEMWRQVLIRWILIPLQVALLTGYVNGYAIFSSEGREWMIQAEFHEAVEMVGETGYFEDDFSLSFTVTAPSFQASGITVFLSRNGRSYEALPYTLTNQSDTGGRGVGRVEKMTVFGEEELCRIRIVYRDATSGEQVVYESDDLILRDGTAAARDGDTLDRSTEEDRETQGEKQREDAADEKESAEEADTTPPKGSIHLPSGGNRVDDMLFYHHDVLVKIKVEEDHFSKEDMTLQVLDENGQPLDENGQPLDDMGESTWKEEDGGHSLDLTISKEGQYTLVMTGRDAYGNVMEKVQSEVFVVDRSLEVLELSLLGEALEEEVYSGDVVPEVRVRDRNLKEYRITLSKREVDGSISDCTEEFLFSEEPCQASDGEIRKAFAYFTAADDGIYLLQVHAEDKAGNIAKSERIFTVNRRGSVFRLEGGIPVSDQTYKQGASSLTIRELNPSSHHGTPQITILWNGTVVGGEDVTVKELSKSDEHPRLGQWHCYEYSFPQELFQADGIYRIQIRTEDVAGHVNHFPQGTREPMTVLVDETPPEVISMKVEEKEAERSEDVSEWSITLMLYDNMGIQDVTLFLDGEEVPIAESDSPGGNYLRLRVCVPKTQKNSFLSLEMTDYDGNRMKMKGKLLKRNCFYSYGILNGR